MDDPWRELFSEPASPTVDGDFLRQAFELWCQDRRISSAALYLSSEERFQLEVSRGGDGYPRTLDSEAGTALQESWKRLEVPGGLVLLSLEAEADEAPDSAATAPRADALLAAALQLATLRQSLKRQSFRSNHRGVELEALYEVGLAVASTLDLDQLCEEILLRAVSLLDARSGALYRLEDGVYRLRGAIGDRAAESVEAEVVGTSNCRGDSPEERSPWLPEVRYCSSVAMETQGGAWGVLVVGDKESRRRVGPFTESDRRTLELFAHQAAIALENAELHRQALEKERLEGEMKLAAEIQAEILPKSLPRPEGLELCGWNRPAQQVGGDYYDALLLEDGRLLVLVADVSGKGMPAALLVSNLHSALKLLVGRVEVGAGLLERLNRHLFEISPVNRFITLMMVEFTPRSGRLRYLNAGHNPALLLRADGTLEELLAGGPPLGLLETCSYPVEAVSFEPGDRLCLYSDGITEAMAAGDREFGQGRLVETLRRHSLEPLEAQVTAMDRSLESFIAGEPQADDQTLLLVSRS